MLRLLYTVRVERDRLGRSEVCVGVPDTASTRSAMVWAVSKGAFQEPAARAKLEIRQGVCQQGFATLHSRAGTCPEVPELSAGPYNVEG